jgi:membrane fusion protein, multidrug efflux system
MKYIISCCIVSLAIAACSSKASETNTKNLQEDVIPVKLAPVNTGGINNKISVSGLLSTENEARLSFKIGGIIENIFVKEGQVVQKGQLLATLKLTEIGAQVQQVQLSVEKAQRDYQRAANLYKDSVATLEQLQNAKTGVDIARQNLQQVSFNKQYAAIYAPSNGFIIKKTGNAGELASAGNPVLIMSAVSGASNWVLKAGLSDREWAAIQKGDKATVTIDAFPGQAFEAMVSKKALAADAVSGSFPVELSINMGNRQPAIGMFGHANIQTKQSMSGYTIPYEALLEASGKSGFVFVTNDQKKVIKAPVIISSISSNEVSVSDGLQGYQYVVVSGSPYLTENTTIQVVK